MSRRVFVLIGIAALALSLSGCAGVRERLTPAPSVVTEEATLAVSGAKVVGSLDAGTPGDLPLWPGAKVVESITTDDAYSLTLTTADEYADVLSGVAAGLEEAGWTVVSDESGEAGARAAVLQITRDTQEGFVTLTELEDGLCQIDYVIAMAAK